MLYFFLSYARGGDDLYVRIFFEDLCEEVRALAGLRPDDEVGFLDNHNIQPGDRWPTALVHALSRCRSFLPLCSPRYFFSEPCGKEWAIFEDRLRRHEELHRTRSTTLIPVRWLPSPRMPEAAVPIQYVAEPQRGPQRADRGVRQLLRLNRNRDDYLEFVSILAELIVNAAHNDPLTDDLVSYDFDAVESAFHHPLTAALGPGPAIPGVIDGVATATSADRVHFVVSAPTVRTARSPAVGRSEVGYYGEAPELWAPYQPRFPEPLYAYAAQIAAQSRLRARVISVDQLDQCLVEARENNQVVVILVDAWSTKIPENRQILYRYDQLADHPAAVMIPFSSEDPETRAHAGELSESVRRTFPRSDRLPENTRFRPSLLTVQSFNADLQTVLTESQNRIFANPVIRRPIPARTTERPILEGP